MDRRHILSICASGLGLGLAGLIMPRQANAGQVTVYGEAPGDLANIGRYRKANAELLALPKDQRRAVFMGDSITDNWGNMPEWGGDFLKHNGFVGRGISGQTSAQMLIRFTSDVLSLNPRAVHILAGTNDIAENSGAYVPEDTANNLAAMASLAHLNHIKVVIGSVPPANAFPWKPELGNPTAKIKALNDWIKAYCAANRFVYCDYWPVLARADDALKPELGLDAVHPNAAGYTAMAPVALKAVTQALETWF